MTIIKAGQIFAVTSGEYSDYRLDGIFRALKDIDPENREQWATGLDGSKLAAKLMQEGFAEELTYYDWYCDN